MLATRSRPSLTIVVHSHSRDRVLLGMTDTNPLLPADEGQCVVGFLTSPEARTAALALLGLAGVEGNDGPVLDLPIDQLLWRRAEYLRSLPYPEYLLTRHWRCCRQKAIERAKGTCQVCNATEGLNVHHRTIRELRGRGRRGPDRLVPVMPPALPREREAREAPVVIPTPPCSLVPTPDPAESPPSRLRDHEPAASQAPEPTGPYAPRPESPAAYRPAIPQAHGSAGTRAFRTAVSGAPGPAGSQARKPMIPKARDAGDLAIPWASVLAGLRDRRPGGSRHPRPQGP
jgi:hypothetical protein